MKYHETPNYVCKIISSSTLANLLARLDERDLTVHYQSHLLSPSWTFQYISDTLNYLASSKRACFIRISSLCAFSALILGSSSSPEYTLTSPSPEGQCTSHLLCEASPTNLSPQAQAVSFYYFVHHILSSLIRMSSLEVRG